MLLFTSILCDLTHMIQKMLNIPWLEATEQDHQPGCHDCQHPLDSIIIYLVINHGISHQVITVKHCYQQVIGILMRVLTRNLFDVPIHLLPLSIATPP